MGEDGVPIRDADGNLTIAYHADQLVNTATTVMGGVQKMFLLHEEGDSHDVECSVAAMTAGLGTLNGVTVAGLADRCRRRHAPEQYRTARAVADDFVTFIRPLWETHVSFDQTAEGMRGMLNDLIFMIAGYGPDDEYIKVFRVSIRDALCDEQFPDAPHCSAAWAGQTSSVARLINGFDPGAQFSVNKAVAETMAAQRQTIVESVLTALRDQGVVIPNPFDAVLAEAVPPTLPWNSGTADIDWANLPTQYAVDLVSALVNAESGLQKFSAGIPTVGGRTRIGLLRRGSPFELVNEPAVIHTHVGYSNDA